MNVLVFIPKFGWVTFNFQQNLLNFLNFCFRQRPFFQLQLSPFFVHTHIEFLTSVVYSHSVNTLSCVKSIEFSF